MIHAHVTSWAIALILFFVSYYLLKTGKPKGQKVTQMILRLFYVLIIITGGLMVVDYQLGLLVLIKAGIGLWVIGSMELVLARGKKGASTTAMWVMFLIALVLVLYFGYEVLG